MFSPRSVTVVVMKNATQHMPDDCQDRTGSERSPNDSVSSGPVALQRQPVLARDGAV